jgi:hypothetical protein
MKGDALSRAGGGGSPVVTPFMLHNLTKTLSEKEKAEKKKQQQGVSRRVVVVEENKSAGESTRRHHQESRFEEERVRIQLRHEEERARKERARVAEQERRDGVLVCKERSGGVQWKYVNMAGKKDMQVMHAQEQRDPIAVSISTHPNSFTINSYVNDLW